MEKIRRPSGVRNENGRRRRKDLSPFRLFDKGISKESYSAGCQPVCSLAPRLVLIKLFPRSPASPLLPRPPKNRLENPGERDRERDFFLPSSLSLFLFSRISRYLDNRGASTCAKSPPFPLHFHSEPILTGNRSDLLGGSPRCLQRLLELRAPLDLQVQLLLQAFPRPSFFL